MTLDSNILIDYLKNDATVISVMEQWRTENQPLFISSISIAEVLSLSIIVPDDLERYRNFLASFHSVPFDNTVAEIAAMLRRTYKLKLPDSGIVATALHLQRPLVTRDKTLKKIKEITVIEI